MDTFELMPLEINRYGRDGTLLKELTGCLARQNFQTEDGFSSSFWVEMDRGYAGGSIHLYEDETLDQEKAAAFLCADCLSAVLDGLDGEVWAMTPARSISWPFTLPSATNDI